MQHKDPSLALRAAIEVLKNFNEQIDCQTVPNISRLDLKEGALVASNQNAFSRKIDLIKSFITSSLFSEKRQKMRRKRELIQQELNKAIEIVKSHYRLIHELKKGNAEEQQLADKAEEVIQDFKTILKQSKEAAPNLTHKIARFFYEQSGLLLNDGLIEFDWPSPSPFQKKFFSTKNSEGTKLVSDNFHSASTRKIAALGVLGKKSEAIPLSKELKEAFYVKVFSLSRQHKIPVTFMELNQSVRSSPIVAKKLEQSKIFMCQILSTIPGEIIRIEGDFKCIHSDENQNTAITGSNFEISYHYQPTGFPDPLYLGWSLADQLIPDFCCSAEQTPLLHSMLQHKKKLAHELLPEGINFENAKGLLTKIKTAFHAEHMELHRCLQKAILVAYQGDSLPADAAETIDKFFDNLVSHPTPFQHYVDTQHIVLDHFISRTYEQLQKDWMTGTFSLNEEKDYGLRAKSVRQYIQEIHQQQTKRWVEHTEESPHLFDAATLKYIDLQVGLLAKSCLNIALQYLSETMRFTPPQLSDFEHKLQAAAYLQQIAFFTLFETPELSTNLASFLQEMAVDHINLFNASSTDSEWVDELESHYHTQYYSAISRR